MNYIFCGTVLLKSTNWKESNKTDTYWYLCRQNILAVIFLRDTVSKCRCISYISTIYEYQVIIITNYVLKVLKTQIVGFWKIWKWFKTKNTFFLKGVVKCGPTDDEYVHNVDRGFFCINYWITEVFRKPWFLYCGFQLNCSVISGVSDIVLDSFSTDSLWYSGQVTLLANLQQWCHGH